MVHLIHWKQARLIHSAVFIFCWIGGFGLLNLSVAYMLEIMTNVSVEQSELGLRCLIKILLKHYILSRRQKQTTVRAHSFYEHSNIICQLTCSVQPLAHLSLLGMTVHVSRNLQDSKHFQGPVYQASFHSGNGKLFLRQYPLTVMQVTYKDDT